MDIIETLEDIEALKESFDIECKLAEGRDGTGAVPKSFWLTYSAFANGEGGRIFLGLKEEGKKFQLVGIKNPQNVKDELFSNLNSRDKVSINLITEKNIRFLKIDGKTILEITIPPAIRTQKPVYINNNPLKTYKRCGTGDMLESPEKVKQMLAEQKDKGNDGELLEGFNINDLDEESVALYISYYNRIRGLENPWSKLNTIEFLQRIKVLAKNWETGKVVLTKAGLLMLGKYENIKDEFPYYFVDYQERSSQEERWKDRITPDSRWSGNLFDFYRKVYAKLTQDLKIPFRVKNGIRQEETLVHIALREALVNSLIHADYTSSKSIVIIKQADMFCFRNPGAMRISVELAQQGGESDCRNPLLQDMFRHIGISEKAGSGIPKIYYGWKEQHWRMPLLRKDDFEQTVLELYMVNLIPEEKILELEEFFTRDVFGNFSYEERLILVTALLERQIDHKRIMSIIQIHPKDLTQIFSKLVKDKFLQQMGVGRGTAYCLYPFKNEGSFFQSDIFSEEDSTLLEGNSTVLEGNSTVLEGNSTVLEGNSTVLGGNSTVLEGNSKIIFSKRNILKQEKLDMILKICEENYISTKEIAKILNLSVASIRNTYIKILMHNKKLELLYPDELNHPKQAYKTIFLSPNDNNIK